MDINNAYDILNISYNSSKEEISNAYKKMVQLYHPDKVEYLAPEYKEIAEKKIKEINEAFEVIYNFKKYFNNELKNKHEENTFTIIQESFFNFAGIRYGDVINRVDVLFGIPEKIAKNPEYDFMTYYYFNDRLSISFNKLTKTVTGINVKNENIYSILKNIGIEDNTLLYLGKNINNIIYDFGIPNGSDAGFYYYELYVPKIINSINKTKRNNYDGLVHFYCPSHNNNNCKEIWNQWFI